MPRAVCEEEHPVARDARQLLGELGEDLHIRAHMGFAAPLGDALP
jgi:hypothetical protein